MTTTTTQARTRLLAATVLATGGLFSAAPAEARCVTTAGVVTCDATAPNPETVQQTAGTITVNTGAAIASAANPAVTETGATVAITNNGSISSTANGGRAINVSGTANARTITLVNNAGGTITSQDDAFRINVALTGGTVTVSNAGTIQTMNGGQALDFDAIPDRTATVSITNAATGVLRSFGQDGIRPGGGATVTNAGLIFADGPVNNSYDGIDFQAHAGTVVNQAGGTISGLRHGITSDTGIVVTNAGIITGRNGSGVGSDGSGTVTNTGTITGAWDGAAINGDGDGVDIDFVANVTNSGTIQGLSAAGVDSGGRPNSAEGVAIGGGSVVNNAGGTIFGAGTGILVNHDTNPGGVADAAVSITNVGTIRGGAGRAITLVGAFDDTITNTGTITGGAMGAIDMGDGNDTLTNSGTITGNVSLGAGDDTLALLPGSVITGTVDGGAGNDRVTLGTVGGGGMGSGSFGGATGFERLDLLSGSWTLTPAPSFPNATTIASGATLIGTTGVLAGTIADAGTLRIDQASDGTFAGVLSGTGALVKGGTGTVTIAAQPGFTGAATVTAGRLSVAGALPSAVTVTGGTLGGTGSVASATIAGGGTIAPGTTGVGTLAVTGNLTQAAGSTYAADIAGTASDRLAVGGSATLAGGARLVIAGDTSAAPIGTRYTLLTAAGGVTGSYTLTQPTIAGTELRLGQSGTAVFADLARSAPALAALAGYPNQRAVAGAFTALGAGNGAYAALSLVPDPTIAPAAFDLLSGEIHASLRSEAVRDAELVEAAVLARARERTAGTGVWASFIADDGQDDGAPLGGAAQQRRNTIGGAGGVDADLGDARVGIAGGYTRTRIVLDGRRSLARLEGKHVLGYAGGTFVGLTLNAAVGYAWIATDTDRAVAFPGFTDRLRADYQTRVLHSVADIGYAIPLGGGSIEPFASAAVYRVSNAAFTETGGAAALRGSATNQRFTLSYVGARAETPIVDGIAARASAAWRHGFDDARTPNALLGFTGGSVPFLVAGAPLSRNAVAASLDLVYAPSERLRLTAGYQGVIGGQTMDNGVKASVSFGF